jgi:hypothetical protein
MLRSFTALAIASGLALAVAAPALAQKGGSGHAIGGPAVNSNSNGINAIDRDKGLDRAGDRNQAQSPAHENPNANGVNAIDRDKGLGRAEDRRNDHDRDDMKR